MSKIKILDCTLRDGGYYNNWDFADNLISDYLNCMKDCSIDYVELGFRSLNHKGFKGPCAYTTNEFINETVNFKKPEIGIMVNGSEILENFKYSKQKVNSLFPSYKNNKLKLVRIACHYEEILKILPICDFLKKRKFKVGINLMQISEISLENIKNITKTLNNHDIDVFYIADSLGTLDNFHLIKILDEIRSVRKGEIGIHAHDNMEKALSNSLTAIDNGVTWVDATVNGMGRGPGNVKTEMALIALSKYRKNKFDIRKIIGLLNKYFIDLKHKYQWGTNPYYYFASQNKIHPTYIQTMLESRRHTPYEIISKINFLSKQNSRKFSRKLLKEKLVLTKSNKGTWEPKKDIKNKEVLIIGNGPSVQKYNVAIERYIRKNKPYVIGFNIEKSVSENLINARAVCAPVKIFPDYSAYKKLNQKFIIPLSSLDEEIKNKLKKINVKNFGYVVKSKKFKFFNNYAIAPSMLALAYGLSIACSGKARKIFIAGLDGWKNNDTLNNEMKSLLKSYNQSKNSVKIHSITPTIYNIDTISVFSL
jgi:4-hydroxy 2-oxovalerate aldolase